MAFDLFACSEFFLDATGGFPWGVSHSTRSPGFNCLAIQL